MIRSEDIAIHFEVEPPYTVPGTLTLPEGAPRRALLLLAGSGPTDRDWQGPLLPGAHGSGRQLAERLAEGGTAVVRIDKAHTGKNPGPPLDQMTLDTYRNEALAALEVARAHAAKVFVAGHSEGAIHAMRVAEIARVDGVLSLSGPGRSLAETMLTQLEGNLRDGAQMPPDEVARRMVPLRACIEGFVAGEAVDPMAASDLPPLQQFLAGLVRGPTAGVVRGLLAFDPARAAAALAPPMFVLAGGKDIQVSADDARRVVEARRAAGKDVTFHLAADADHVLKHEPRAMAELRANLATIVAGYAADRPLDEDAASAIAGWLAAHAQ